MLNLRIVGTFANIIFTAYELWFTGLGSVCLMSNVDTYRNHLTWICYCYRKINRYIIYHHHQKK